MPLSNRDITNNPTIFSTSSKLIKKIAVIGDSGVGKTSLIKRMTSNTFTLSYNMTIGGDFTTKKLPLPNGKFCTYIFSDVSGQDRFKEMRQIFYAGVDLVFAVFDLTRKQSLINLEKLWIPEFLSTYSNDSKLKIQIVANKSDLLDYFVINPNDLEQSTFRISMKFPQVTILNPCIITSAKNNLFDVLPSRKQENTLYAQ